MGPRTRRNLAVLGVVLVLIATWELYKLVWSSLGWIRPVRPDDVVMPHVWDMFLELLRPVRRGGQLLIYPSSGGIGVMNEDLWAQTVEIATSQIPELQGVEISADSYRSDMASAAVERLEADGIDVMGEGYERREIELQPGGE